MGILGTGGIAALGLGVVAFLAIGSYLLARGARQRVEAYLRARGAVNVQVPLVWFTGDRSSTTFEVRYILHGETRQNRCQVPIWGEELYWRDPQ